VEWSLGTLLMEPVSLLQEFLTLWRHDSQDPFTEIERQTKELLMPHIADAHREARLRAVLGEPSERNLRWAVADDRGFLHEVSPGFVHCLREHWPDWQGSRLPQTLLESVCLAKSFNTAGLQIKITLKGQYRYLQVRALSAMDRLTAREVVIVTRYAQGETYTMIAAALSISPATVRNHIAKCYHKLSVNNKSELLLRMSQAS
jgi:DNA-binding CsgD family transcriptional regulator